MLNWLGECGSIGVGWSSLHHSSVSSCWAVSTVLAWALLGTLLHLLGDSAGVLDVLLKEVGNLLLSLDGSLGSWGLFDSLLGKLKDLSEGSGNGSG